jgi:hypothetical protein
MKVLTNVLMNVLTINVLKAYKIQVNGSFHCTVRYKQLYNFHEQVIHYYQY